MLDLPAALAAVLRVQRAQGVSDQRSPEESRESLAEQRLVGPALQSAAGSPRRGAAPSGIIRGVRQLGLPGHAE